MECNVLKWFGHVERIGEEALVKYACWANGECHWEREILQRRMKDSGVVADGKSIE